MPGKTVNIQSKHEMVTKSMLTIDQVTQDSAGTYSCMPDKISPAIINISIVKNREEQMAVTNSVTNISGNIILCLITLFVISDR